MAITTALFAVILVDLNRALSRDSSGSPNQLDVHGVEPSELPVVGPVIRHLIAALQRRAVSMPPVTASWTLCVRLTSTISVPGPRRALLG